MQDVWQFSPLQAGVGLAPAPVVSIGFAVSAGPIQRRFGRTLPALVGTVTMALAARYWLLRVSDTRSYWTAMFPALVLMGISGGLSQAPMFAADRATTGSAVLNMSRQVGGAIGVALLVALTAASNSVTAFDHAWWVQVGAGLLAATTLLLLCQHRTTPPRHGADHAVATLACSTSETNCSVDMTCPVDTDTTTRIAWWTSS
jgi:hypothetical protein